MNFKQKESMLVLGLLVTLAIQASAQQAQQPAAVGVTIQYDATTQNNNVGPDFMAFNRIIYVAPGGGIPLHWHPGPLTLTVLEGELTLETKDGNKVYKVGDSWTDGVGPENAHALWNKGKLMAKYSVIGLIPKGQPVQTFVTK